MSWSVSFIGYPSKVAEALENEKDKLDGQSKLEYEAALPSLVKLVQENFSREDSGNAVPIVSLSASGSGYSRNDQQVYRNLTVNLQPLYSKLV